MPVVIIYMLIIVGASVVGSISGMGGGILIKPAFDFMRDSTVQNITFFSSVSVFTMSIVSITRQIHDGRKLRKKPAIYLGGGSIIGGVIGNELFLGLGVLFASAKWVSGIQIGATVIVLTLVLFNSLFDNANLDWNNRTTYGLSGIILGATASFLGIGGGPLNSSLLKNVSGFDIKEANFYSLFIIFLSQAANLISLGITTQFKGYQLGMLLYIIPAAFVGGLVGAMFTKILSNKAVTIIFNVMILLTVLLNAFNWYSIVIK